MGRRRKFALPRDTDPGTYVIMIVITASSPLLHSNLNAWKLSKLALLIANLPASSDENTSYQITDNVLVQLSNPENIQYSVWVSYLELYNENVYDLLQPPPEQGLLYFEYFTIDI